MASTAAKGQASLDRRDRLAPFWVWMTSLPNGAPFGKSDLTPEERERRIAYYAARAARRLPLFEDGPPDRRPKLAKTVIVCCACGDTCKNGRRAHKLGWRSRKMLGHGATREVYCPLCLEWWGWGDEDIAQQPLCILRRDPTRQ